MNNFTQWIPLLWDNSQANKLAHLPTEGKTAQIGWIKPSGGPYPTVTLPTETNSLGQPYNQVIDFTSDITGVDENGLGVSKKILDLNKQFLALQPGYTGYATKIAYVGMRPLIAGNKKLLAIFDQQIWDAGNYPNANDGSGFTEHPDEVGIAGDYKPNADGIVHRGNNIAYAFAYGRNFTTLQQVMQKMVDNFANYHPVDADTIRKYFLGH